MIALLFIVFVAACGFFDGATSVSLNEQVDSVIVAANKIIKEKSYDSISLPDQSKSFKASIFWCSFKVTGGSMKSFASLKRQGDAEIVQNEKTGTSTVKTKLEFSNLSFEYQSFKVHVFLAWSWTHIWGHVGPHSLSVEVESKKTGDKCESKITAASLDRLDSLTVTTESGPIRNKVKNYVNDQLRNRLGEIKQKINSGLSSIIGQSYPTPGLGLCGDAVTNSTMPKLLILLSENRKIQGLLDMIE